MRRNLIAAIDATAEPPFSAAWRRQVAERLRCCREAVWRMTADPDEYLRHLEAECYDRLIALLN